MEINATVHKNEYEWEQTFRGVRLTRYNGDAAEVVVPSEYPEGSGNPVVELKGTFADNKCVKSVRIPSTVITIGDYAFSRCEALADVYFPASILTISWLAFDGCCPICLHCARRSLAEFCAKTYPSLGVVTADPDDFPGEWEGEEDFYKEVCAAPAESSRGDDDKDYFDIYNIFNRNQECEEEHDQPEMGFGQETPPTAPSVAAPDMSMPAPPMPAPMPPVPSVNAGGGEAASGRDPKKVKPVRSDKVSFSALSPEKVEKGTYSTVSVYMYTKSQRKVVERAMKSAKEAVAETAKSGFIVSRGSEVTVELCSDDVTIKENRETRTWNGGSESFDFMFFVPEDYSRKQIGFTCYVYFNGVQITRLNFIVGLRSTGRRVPVKVKRSDNRHVFVSYSHRDTQRVLAHLVEIQEVAPKMTFWLDSQSLETGDVWRKEIKRAIDKADGLFLFWSVYSMLSAEVEKEWRYALSKKGSRFITPVPLDPTEQCPPPAELSDRHFGHRAFAYTEDMDKLNFRNSKRVRIVK